MNKKDWIKFKNESEESFKKIETVEDTYGFQIQKNTKWNKGLAIKDIEKLENHFGFKFPSDYFDMLQFINGFDTPSISIDPEGEDENEFERRFYKYPDDLEKTQWRIDEANHYINIIKIVLDEGEFDSNEIEGFIPIYSHRVLVVLKNKHESPVLSIWGSDIIIYENSLFKYMNKEF